MLHEQLTSRIIESCFEVMNELGEGFLESVYENALSLVLREKGFKVENQAPLPVLFRGHEVGRFFADLVVEDEVIVELKAVDALHSTHQAQLINYLKATSLKTGLLVNFGKMRIEIKRCHG